MKFQFTKKLFAFIITIMMFSGMSGITNAQQSIANEQSGLDLYSSCSLCSTSPPYVWCGCGLQCKNGHCRRVLPWKTDPIHTNEVLSLSNRNSADFSLQLTEAQYVSLKIYDMTGRLIKTLAESMLPQGENQIEWNQTDDYGNTVSAGVYILHLDAGPDNSDTVKLSVMN